MIFAEELIKSILKKKINFFTGVPDSILKPLSEILQKKIRKVILLQQMKEAQFH